MINKQAGLTAVFSITMLVSVFLALRHIMAFHDWIYWAIMISLYVCYLIGKFEEK